MGRVAVAWRVYCGGDRSAWGCPRHTGLAHPTGISGGTLWVLPQSGAVPFSDVRGVLAGATWKKTSAKTFLVKNKTKCFFMD